MGIPKLFQKLKSDNSNAKRHYKNGPFYGSNPNYSQVKKLYIDFTCLNGIILDEHPELNGDTEEVYKKLEEYTILKLMSIFYNFRSDCEKHIYFESVASVSKLNENINRRLFQKIKSDVEENLKKSLNCEEEIDNSLGFGHASFTSKFTENLIKRISELNFHNLFIHKYEQTNPDENKGEAEHRILNHIRRSNFDDGDTYLIYTVDSDVILISVLLSNIMSTLEKKLTVNVFVIEKEDESDKIYSAQPKIKYYQKYFDTEKYIEYLKNKITIKKDNYKNLLNDLIFCLNIIGNDFIPGLYSASAFDMDSMINIIDNIKGDIVENINNNYKINNNNLLIFFSKFEPENRTRNYNILDTIDILSDEYFEKNHKKMIYNILIKQLFKYGNYYCERETSNNTNNFKINEQNQGFCEYDEEHNNWQYYFLKLNGFGVGIRKYSVELNNINYKKISLLSRDNKRITQLMNVEEKKDQVKKYLEGFDFILNLYFNSHNPLSTNYFWYYDYQTSPTIADIKKYLLMGKIPSHNITDYNPNQYISPQQYKDLIELGKNINYDYIKKIYGDITYDKIGSYDHRFQILYTKGINYFSKFYTRKKFYIDPKSFIQNQDNPVVITRIFKYDHSMS